MIYLILALIIAAFVGGVILGKKVLAALGAARQEATADAIAIHNRLTKIETALRAKLP